MRSRIWQAYADGLQDWSEQFDVRTRLTEHLRRAGILSVFHYSPLNLSAMGQRYGGRPGQCPVAEEVSDRLLRLPFYTGLSTAEQADVIGEIRAFDCG